MYCHSKEGKVYYACFVDFTEAFDTVIHAGIRLKLLKYRVGNRFYNIIKNMYSKGHSCVKIHNNVGDFFGCAIGVKQGDNLSPNLFTIFINDLPQYFHTCSDSASVNTSKIECLMYADDIIISLYYLAQLLVSNRN